MEKGRKIACVRMCKAVCGKLKGVCQAVEHVSCTPSVQCSTRRGGAGARKLADMVSSSVDMVSSGVSTAVSSVERELHTAPRPADLGTRQLHS
eukprot:273917-Chlamydomonas_euryale.AAC.1